MLRTFDAARPALFGALLDVVAGVLRELPYVSTESLPRMADFARIGIAVEKVLGWPAGTFLSVYAENIGEQHSEALAASPVGEALCTFMESRTEWEGTAQGLLDLLNQQFSEKAKQKEWPKNSRSVSVHLKRIAPNLRGAGIWADMGGRNTKKRIVRLEKKMLTENTGNFASFASLRHISSQNAMTQNSDYDANQNAAEVCVIDSLSQNEANDANDANDAKFPTLSKASSQKR